MTKKNESEPKLHTPGGPQKVLVLSDTHIGAKISAFGDYKANIIALMSQYDHVVLNGDIFELFYVSDTHTRDISSLLEVISGKPADKWEKEFRTDKQTAYHGVKNVMHGGKMLLQEFMEACPHVKLHLPLGNHEKIVKFRKKLDKLQHDYKNFEWHPEAIRIGDALFTHGHLPLGKQTDEQMADSRLRHAGKEGKWTNLFRRFDWPAHQVVGMARSSTRTPALVSGQFSKWEADHQFSYSHEREKKPFTQEWIKHIFIGHTHHKYDNVPHKGVLHHNTGSIVESTSNKPEDLGILEARLDPNGTINDVRPVQVLKDLKIYPAATAPNRG